MTANTDSRANIRINGERLWDSIMEMAKIGPGVAGGNNRQTLTDDDAKGRELFQRWCEEPACRWVLTKWAICSLPAQGKIPRHCLCT